jgi:hypothetical protein
MKTQLPEDGSKWVGPDYKIVFTVLHTVELEDNTWVHYRNDKQEEYSCYIESFLQRFSEVPK